ncbi:helix-turn-helix domain-containing protein [Corynebacteriaceae bacterium 7-707]
MRDVVDRSRMFAMVPYDIIKEVQDGNAIALYAVLKMYAGANGKSHPSRSTLAEHLGYKSPRMVDRALDRLSEFGLVKIIPRFKDEDGNIGYERTDLFREQTSNGYVIYDRIVRQDQLQFDTPLDTGVHTPTHPCPHPLDTGVHTPYTPVLHEGYSLEGDTPEGDISPCSPPEGDAVKKDPGTKQRPGSSSSRKKPKRRLAEDWTPRDDIRQQLADECPDVDQDHELNQFRDHFIAKDQTSTDWNLNYRRWIRTEQKRYRGPRRGGGPTKFDQIMQAGMSLHGDQKEISW